MIRVAVMIVAAGMCAGAEPGMVVLNSRVKTMDGRVLYEVDEQ